MSKAKPAALDWLPELCRPGAVFLLMVLAQVVVLVALLAPNASGLSIWDQLGPASLLAQWVLLSSLPLLCAARAGLLRLGPVVGGAVALAMVGFTAGLVALLVQSFGDWLSFPAMADRHFVLRVAVLSTLVALVALRYGYMHQLWKAQVRANVGAELEALQARIRPHFLFNSLNTIASLARSAPKSAEAAALDLSDLLRAALRSGADLVTLGEELELCERYLAIEQLRLGERLEVVIRRDGINTAQLVPLLSLQPLVENAVLHGVQHCPQGGKVELWGERAASRQRIWVRNPVCGPSAAGLGIGQENVRMRLLHALGPDAELRQSRDATHYLCELDLPAR